MEVLHQIKFNGTAVAVGYHQGFDIDPEKMMFEKEKEIIQQLSPRKRSEWLASRELLFRIAKLPERPECVYDDFGKPFLKGIDKHISVSHSGPWASAMISDKSCGVDIQVYTHTVERIASRFLAEAEMSMAKQFDNPWHVLHLMWCAKECMYKAYGKKKLEFRHHIFVNNIDLQNCRGTGEIRYENIHLPYEIHFRILPEAAWVFCVLLRAIDTDRH
jgi:4'-phosphopantetheinyl transferase